MNRDFQPFALARFLHPDNRQTRTKRGQKTQPWNNAAQPMSPASRVRTCSVLMGLLLAFSTLLRGQTNVVPQGSEYAVSGPLAGDQLRPAVAIGSGGGFAVWDDNITDPSGLGVSARRLNASMSPVGEVFRVNQTMGTDQQNARIVLLNDGGAVIVWEGGKHGAHNIFARFLNVAGTFVTDEIVVNQIAFQGVRRYPTNWTLIRNNKALPRRQNIRDVVKNRQEFNSNPIAATLSDGSVVVVYSSSRKGSMQTLGLNETIRWDDRRSIFITNRTRVPLNLQFDYMSDVFAQRLSATGEKLGSEIVVNHLRDYNQRNASVAALTGGGFIVCWINEIPGIPGRISSGGETVRAGGQINVYARLFGSDGNPAGPEFRVDTSASPCGAPTVAGKAGGGFTVAWVERDAVRENGLDIWFRSFDAASTALGSPVRANSYLFGDQFSPAITTIGGRQLLVWSSMGQDRSWEGVYARLLSDNSLADAEFRVNTKAYLRQIHPGVSSVGNQAIVIWSSYTFGSGHDLFAQRYQVP
jgi:hypothetical protein